VCPLSASFIRSLSTLSAAANPKIKLQRCTRTKPLANCRLECQDGSMSQNSPLSAPNGSASTPLAIVLAAGKGTRMHSDLPKVLVPVRGRPMVRYVIDTLHHAGIDRICMVVGYQADLVRRELADIPGLEFALQEEQLGTGHAVMTCRKQLAAQSGPVLIVTGDSPVLQVPTIERLLAEFRSQAASCLMGTVDKEDPTGLGRIVRDAKGNFLAIVEEKDATQEQRELHEINASTYLFNANDLLQSLDSLTNTNAQQEYYVTDCPGILLAAGKSVAALKVLHPSEALSINSMDDLKQVELAMEPI
jgi:UDP-N-acetylglucosamine diphosphorylase/glucosamine-1-phosphate N-acetyltransferase